MASTAATQTPVAPSKLGSFFGAVGLLRESPIGMIGAALLLFWVAMAILAPILPLHDPNQAIAPFQKIWAHGPKGDFFPLGTDHKGRDILSRLIWGSQRVWTKGHPKRLGRTNTPIYITVGEPIAVGKGSAAAEEANDLLRERMTAQLHADQDAYPPLGPDERHFLPVRLGGTAPTLEEANAMDEEEVRRRRGAAPA